jgi:hypothetical protein
MIDRESPTTTELSQELAEALDMLLSVATDKRTILPKGELYTNMALNGARQALCRAKAAGIHTAQGDQS